LAIVPPWTSVAAIVSCPATLVAGAGDLWTG
jgi:hypothetical protein